MGYVLLDTSNGNILILVDATVLHDRSKMLDFYGLMHATVAVNKASSTIIVFDVYNNHIGKEYGVFDASTVDELKELLSESQGLARPVLVVPLSGHAEQLLRFVKDYSMEYRNVTFIYPVFNTKDYYESVLSNALKTRYKLTLINTMLAKCIHLSSTADFNYCPSSCIRDWEILIQTNKEGGMSNEQQQ